MAYAQWIILNIINTLRTQNIQVDNANLNYGKFHTVGNRNDEISASAISNMQILAQHSGEIASSGRQDSPTGTEGSIDLYHAGTKICTVNWDCPWSGKNLVEVRNSHLVGHLCKLGTWNSASGPIGDVRIEVYQGLAIVIKV